MAIEKFTPNIKNPGINKATGAYARGDIAEQADWSQVYNAIDKSFQGMMGAIAETIAIDKALLKTLTEKDDQFKKGIANLQESGNSALDKTSDQIISDVSGGEKTEWFQLNRRERKEAISKLNDVQGVKNVITSVISDIGTGNINDLNWSNFSKNVKVKEFFNHIMNNEAAPGTDLFTLDTSGNTPVIKFAGKELAFQDLQSGATIFKSGKEMKTSIKDLLQASITTGIQRRDSLANSPDSVTGGKKMDMERFLQESRDNIKNLSETEDNYEFIFNNLTHTIDPRNRATIYDPNNEQHVADVEQYINDYITNGMGEDPQLDLSAEQKQSREDRASGVVRLGGRAVDAATNDRAEELTKVVQSLVPDAEGKMFEPGSLPRFEENYGKTIRTGIQPKTIALDEAMENYIAKDFIRGRGILNFKNQLNNVIDKYNSGESLTPNQQSVLSAYKVMLGGFDEKVNLKQHFDPGAVDLSEPINYDRNSKIVTLTLKGATKPQPFNLRKPSERKKFFELLMEFKNTNRETGGYAIDHYYSKGDILFDDIDESKPEL